MYARDKVNILNTFLVYHTLAALKYKGKYKNRHVGIPLFHLFLFIIVILRHIQRGCSRATLHQSGKRCVPRFLSTGGKRAKNT